MERHKLTQINPVNKTAFCSIDGIIQIHPRNKKHTRWTCSVTANLRTQKYKNKFREKKKKMLKTFCEICERSNIKLCWDHKHINKNEIWDSTKFDISKYRGTLCNRCNMAIGLFHDDINLLLKARNYLIEKNRQKTT